MGDIKESETRPQMPQPERTPFNDPPPFSTHRPPSPPASPPPSPEPPGFDNTPSISGRNTPVNDDYPPCTLSSMTMSVDFIWMVREVSLESQLSIEELATLRNPWDHNSTPEVDHNLKHSIRNFIDLLGCPQGAYTAVRQNLLERDPGILMLLYDQVKCRVQNLSGVLTWEHHMCVDSCVGFTGPFADLEHCPRCGKPCYDQRKLKESEGLNKVPQKVFTTFPVGPQLQAHWKSAEMAEKMFYHWCKTQELRQEHAGSADGSGIYDDILSGNTYLSAVEDSSIGEYDTVLMLSIDGVQLYEHKQSDCWIYIWIILDLGPDKRYKVQNILLGGVIPGPKPPDNIESFLFPGLAHLSALQKEGLHIWDTYHLKAALSFLFLILVLADAVMIAQLSSSSATTAGKAVGYSADLSVATKLRVLTTTQLSFNLWASKTTRRPLTLISTLPPSLT